MFLEVARPPDFEISPSWGVAQKEASVLLLFSKTPLASGLIIL